GPGSNRRRRVDGQVGGRSLGGGVCRSRERRKRDLGGRRVTGAGGVRQWAGSIAFTLYLFLSVPVYALIVVATAPLPHRLRYRTALGWVNSVLYLLRVLCRLDFVVEGKEHLPADGAVVLMKHSSAFETI